MTADLPQDSELDEEMHCPECGAVMDPDDTTCPKCWAQFGFYCPECDEEIPADATICHHCGAELEEGFEDEGTDEPKEESDPAIERAAFCGECGGPIGKEDEECPSCGVDLCLDCGGPLGEEDQVCPICGAEFAFSCPECGEDLPADAVVCSRCGFDFEEGQEDG